MRCPCCGSVDDLNNTADLEQQVARSACVIVLLTGSASGPGGALISNYMTSANCIRELRHAVRASRKLCFVLECAATTLKLGQPHRAPMWPSVHVDASCTRPLSS